jgi:hypothetical protein
MVRDYELCSSNASGSDEMQGFGLIGRLVAVVWVSPRTTAVTKHLIASLREGLLAVSELSGGVADEIQRRGEPTRSSLNRALRLCEGSARGFARHLSSENDTPRQSEMGSADVKGQQSPSHSEVVMSRDDIEYPPASTLLHSGRRMKKETTEIHS